jgi:hypothetical protein
MFSKSNIIMSAAIALGLLGGALPALAGYNYDGPYGGPTQTWCDVNPDCNGWNKRLHAQADPNGTSVVVAPLNQNQKRRPPHKRSHDASDRQGKSGGY